MKVDTSNIQPNNNDEKRTTKVKESVLNGLVADIMFGKLLQKAVDKVNESSNNVVVPPVNTTTAEQKVANAIGDEIALDNSAKPCCKCGKVTHNIYKGDDGRYYCYACISREDK